MPTQSPTSDFCQNSYPVLSTANCIGWSDSCLWQQTGSIWILLLPFCFLLASGLRNSSAWFFGSGSIFEDITVLNGMAVPGPAVQSIPVTLNLNPLHSQSHASLPPSKIKQRLASAWHSPLHFILGAISVCIRAYTPQEGVHGRSRLPAVRV